MKISSIVSKSSIYGPGIRTVIWFQGCSIRCPGCWNKEMWSFDGGVEMSSNEIIDIALSEGSEGITLLGGEPLDQAQYVEDLVIKAKRKGLTVMLYTGYEGDELHGLALKAFNESDIVVYGRYQEEERNTRLLWRGSENQKVKIQSDRYFEYHSKISEEAGEFIEIHVHDDGTMHMLGYPDESMRGDFLG